MPVEPIKPRRLYQEVADQLTRLIAKGEYKPGGRLPAERELAASLQVSRPTIREAMIALELAGVIEIRTGSGIFVRGDAAPSARKDTGPGPFELMEARLHIEGEAAAIAARNISDLELEELTQANRRMERLAAGHRPAETTDRQFHRIIARATRNSAMAAAVEQLWEFRARMPMWRKLHEVIREIEKRRDWSDDSLAVMDHRDIIAALAARDPDGARRAMQAHLKRVTGVLMAASELDLINIKSDQDRSAGE
ncbi:MAG: GntR family transcriptional regulator [Hyphomicrobiales bacterium]|nr:MAG: GntR family transcriptional regulator [Hyphomicrobiales bacterium]